MSEGGGDIAGLLLAGGLARRMGGGDKCLKLLANRPLLAHVIDRVRPQVDRLVLNANGDLDRFSSFRLPIIADVVEGYAGPLAGILSGLEWLNENAPETGWVLSVPTDAPFLPRDLVSRLYAAVDRDADLAVAASGGRAHPVIALWPAGLAAALRRALIDDDVRKIDQFTADYKVAQVSWQSDPIDPFFNANRPDDIKKAEKILTAA